MDKEEEDTEEDKNDIHSREEKAKEMIIKENTGATARRYSRRDR